MLGALIGDIAGSRFEWHNQKSKDFTLFHETCHFTDDSVMTLAVAQALLECGENFTGLEQRVIATMQAWGRAYPHVGYGDRFQHWLLQEQPQPYNSYGNGSAMRVSGCGWAGKSLEQVKRLAAQVTRVTHNHPEGLKGAEATAVAIYLARTGSSKEEIRSYVEKHYYVLDFTLDDIREDYSFDVSCQGSVPQALEAFLESTSFEDAIRKAISLGGDSDTIAAIAGSVAEAYYGVPMALREQALTYLDEELLQQVELFEQRFGAGRAAVE